MFSPLLKMSFFLAVSSHPFYFPFFYSPLLCVLKVPFKRNSSTLQNHQPSFSMAIGSPVSLEESSSLRIPYSLHKKVSQISKISFSYFKIYPLHYYKKKKNLIFQSKNLIFYFFKKKIQVSTPLFKKYPDFFI